MRFTKKKTLFAILIFLTIANLYAQHDYYVKDGKTTFVLKIYDKGDDANSKFCIVKQNKKDEIKFSPDEIEEYGLKNGKIYISKTINISNKAEKVFLQRLTEGKTTLYYYKGEKNKLFFIEKDSSSLIYLPKTGADNKNYKTTLYNYTKSCNEAARYVKLVSYKKKAFTRYIENFNNCTNKPLPFFKYGVIVGYELNKPFLSKNSHEEDLKSIDFKYQGGFIFGAFIDNPLIKYDISLHIEGYLSQNNFSYATPSLDMLVSTTSISFPILLRYTYPSYKRHFFLNAGGVFTYNIKNENILYHTSIINNKVSLSEKYKNTLISDTQLGFSLGGGIQISIDYKRSVFIELRYSNLFNLEYAPDMLNNNIFHLVTSVNF